MKPISEDLGVSRSLLTLALVTTTTTGAVVNPFFGWLIDRYGTRKTLLSIIPVFAAGVAGYSLLTPAPAVIFAIFFAVGLTGTITGPVPYATLIARWFDRERGLALGIAMAGVGLGTSVIPPIVAYLIGAYGWRAAYVGLGAVILVVAGLPVLLFIREPSEAERARQPDFTPGPLPGVSFAAALQSWRLWAMIVAFLLGVIALNGVLTQIVAMLTDRGYGLQEATTVLAVSGVASLVGRVLSGWCVDRFFGPYVAISFYVLPIVGMVLFGSGAGEPVPILGAVLCGAALGGEIDIMGFFVSRYFGLKSYGKIFGTMFGFFAGATGVGPFISGLSFDHYHSYVPAFALYDVGLVVACFIFFILGPYPFPARHAASRGLVGKVPA
jgi:MFS family permease